MSAATLYVSNNTKPRTKYPGQWWVRIKPYSPNTGAVVQTIRVRKLGSMGSYAEKSGWYRRKLTRAQVKLHLDTRVNPHDASTPCVFDVCTFEEADALDRAAKTKVKAAGGRRDASDELDGVFTTDDLPERTEKPKRRPKDDDAQTMAARREQQRPPVPSPSAADTVEDDVVDTDDDEDADLDFEDME